MVNKDRTSMERAVDAEDSFNMKCWHCRADMIWGADFDYEDYGYSGEGIVSSFSCSNCEATAEVCLPFNNENS